GSGARRSSLTFEPSSALMERSIFAETGIAGPRSYAEILIGERARKKGLWDGNGEEDFRAWGSSERWCTSPMRIRNDAPVLLDTECALLRRHKPADHTQQSRIFPPDRPHGDESPRIFRLSRC